MKRLILIDTEQGRYKQLYTIPEAVEKTGKSRATLFRWRKLDKIKFEKVGRNVYISQAELDRIILVRYTRKQVNEAIDKAIRWGK